MKLNNLYTIGYSGFTESNFILALKKYSIEAVVDVRSIPYSKRFEAYNEAKLKIVLKEHKIHYLFFGDYLGARPKDNLLYTNNEVDFIKFAKSEQFLSACQRLRNGLDKCNICLLCSEKDPTTCHRSILISRHFKLLFPEVKVFHILSDTKVETQCDIERRLLKKYKLDSFDLLRSPEEQLNEAYEKRAHEIAYKETTNYEGFEE